MIGNPPYIQLQKMGGDSDLLQQVGYETFTRTGDIYALFYEKGYQMLKPGGCLAYITSNKWLRASYGEKLRTFFIEKTNPLTLLDFNDYQLFDNAVLLANIMVLTKEANKRQTAVCKINRDFKQLRSLRPYLENRTVMEEGFSSSSWVVMDSTRVAVKRKIEAQGIPLKDWAIKISRGILTGLNPAFVINGQKKDELIAEDPKSAEVIRPLLRGRDIDPYQIQFADQWLLFIPWHFPLHTDPSVTGNSAAAEVAFATQYPAVYKHLLSFKPQLSARNASETGIRYEWYALQRFGSNYYQDFEKPKIIYPNMTSVLPFVYDKGAFYINDKCYMITGDNLPFLTCFFGSKLFRYCFKDNFPELPGVTRELRKIFFDEISVKKPSNDDAAWFERATEQLQQAKKRGADTLQLEADIEERLCHLYNLSAEEIVDVMVSENQSVEVDTAIFSSEDNS